MSKLSDVFERAFKIWSCRDLARSYKIIDGIRAD